MSKTNEILAQGVAEMVIELKQLNTTLNRLIDAGAIKLVEPEKQGVNDLKPSVQAFLQRYKNIKFMDNPTEDVYGWYLDVCRDGGFHPLSKSGFSKQMVKYGANVVVKFVNGKSIKVYRTT